MEKNTSVTDRLARMKVNCMNEGMRTSMEGILLAVHRRERKTPTSTTTTTSDIGRRCLLLSTLVAAPQVADSRTDLLKQYLKKSEENKSKNDKERLDSYYKRNYKDYFEFVEGASKGNQEQLSEAEKGIIDWLQKNK